MITIVLLLEVALPKITFRSFKSGLQQQYCCFLYLNSIFYVNSIFLMFLRFDKKIYDIFLTNNKIYDIFLTDNKTF